MTASRLRIIRERVTRLLDGLPLFRFPGPMDAMRVLDEIALNGIRFPAGLLMFRKAWFTLDGVLEDTSRSSVRMDSVIARYALAHWAHTGAALFSLLSPSDWVALDWSTLTLTSRLSAQALSPFVAVGTTTTATGGRGAATFCSYMKERPGPARFTVASPPPDPAP